MKKLNSSGFSAVEALLVIVILGALSFMGWFVVHAKQNTDNTLKDTNNSTAAKVAPKKPASTTPTSNTNTTSTAVQAAKLSAVTQLQAAVISHLKATNGCLNADGKIISEAGDVTDPEVKYVMNSAAFVPVCQSVSLYAFTNGNWQYIDKTQLGFSCTTLKQYSVATQLVATQGSGKCLDNSGQSVSYEL